MLVLMMDDPELGTVMMSFVKSRSDKVASMDESSMCRLRKFLERRAGL